MAKPFEKLTIFLQCEKSPSNLPVSIGEIFVCIGLPSGGAQLGAPLQLEEEVRDERSWPGWGFSLELSSLTQMFKDSTHTSLPYLRNEEKGGKS